MCEQDDDGDNQTKNGKRLKYRSNSQGVQIRIDRLQIIS